MKKFADEFKQFAIKGNVMSLAVGMIIGLAFQDVVSSLTENIISPIIGLFVGQNFDHLEWHVLGVSLRYGAFITSVVNFILLALVVFLMIKGINRLLHKDEEPAPPAEPKRLCPFCKLAVHTEATRCGACTSVLPNEQVG